MKARDFVVKYIQRRRKFLMHCKTAKNVYVVRGLVSQVK